MKTKSSSTILKAVDDAGTGTAVFATLNIIDRDGDLTPPGAFGMQTVKLVGAHDWSAPSIGMAKISESGDEAIADFRFNLSMSAADEWYKSLKFNFANGIRQEFSYGFEVLKERFEDRDGRQVRILEQLKVLEISPVLMGAGINTHLNTIKGVPDPINAEIIADYWKQAVADELKEGRILSRATRSRLAAVLDQNRQLAAVLETLLAETDPDEGKNLVLLDIEVEQMLREHGGAYWRR